MRSVTLVVFEVMHMIIKLHYCNVKVTSSCNQELLGAYFEIQIQN